MKKPKCCLLLVITDLVTKNCKHLSVGRKYTAAQERGGKGIVCFGLGLSLLHVLRWCIQLACSFPLVWNSLWNLSLQNCCPQWRCPNNLVGMSGEGCSDFLLMIKFQKYANEATTTF